MKAVDLFAGCGGLSLGLSNAGIEVVAAFELWEPAIEIYRRNFSHPVFQADLSDVAPVAEQIRAMKVDLIAGGPPCQDFSSAGKRDETGGRGDLTLSFAQLVSSVRPEWFVMENVERIQKTKIFQTAKELLRKSGYGLTEIVLDASLCGVPQRRKRLFLIGRQREQNNFLTGLLESRLAKNALTLREYFGKTLNTNFYYRHARSYARRGIFSIDEPSPTVRGVNRPIPPDYKPHAGDATNDLSIVRPLTTMERASIQTFPDNFDWGAAPKTTVEQIIGNAVPVNLGWFVADAILSYSLGIHDTEFRWTAKDSRTHYRARSRKRTSRVA